MAIDIGPPCAMRQRAQVGREKQRQPITAITG